MDIKSLEDRMNSINWDEVADEHMKDISPHLTDNELLELYGWTVECESPFEARHSDGSFVSGRGYNYLINGLREDHEQYRTFYF